jgi:Alr-MurF fusion protein
MISLQDLLEAANGQLFGEAAGHLFSGFCLDVRRVQPRDIFVATRGDYVDTHQDMPQAVAAGATGLLCNTPPDFDTEGVTVIVVKDPEAALMSWAQATIGKMKAKPVIVAGTAGQATTIESIRRVLQTAYNVHATPYRLHPGRLHIPLALADLQSDHDFVVLDLQANLPGELSQAVQTIEPEVTVINNIGQAFLTRFQTVERIAQDHEVTLKYLPPNGLAVLNYNDDVVRPLQQVTSARTLTIGVDSYGPDLQAFKVIIGPNGTGFDLRYGEQRIVGRWTPLLGRHQLYSVLSALAVGLHYDIPLEQGLKTLAEQQPLLGRMNTLIGENGCILVDDTYDATPESTLEALDWLEDIKAKDPDSRFVFVFGDMDHLGEATRAAHRSVGRRAAEVADVILTEGGRAALAGRAAQDTAAPEQLVFIAHSIKDAVDTLRHDIALNENDIVLLKGGSNARMEMIVRALLPDTNDHGQLVRQTDIEGLGLTEESMRPSWLEIDREVLANNVQVIKQMVGDDVTLMATVKADAYGHGAVAVSRVALRNGAEYLAVASISEALELRNAGIDAPILVLSYTPVYAVRDAIRNDITITIYDLELARAYHKIARELHRRLKVHVKLDTGMGRLGILPEDAVTLFRHLAHMQHIEIEGIYTHFSMADADRDFTMAQVQAFKETLMPVRAAGINIKYVHAANSAGVLLDTDIHFSLVRTGILMYGGKISALAQTPPGLQPLMTWKTVIAQVKTLPPGHAVGYGNTYFTRREERVAVIPVGYGDGFRRTPNWGEVLVNGQRAPIRGRVSMEKTVISLEGIDKASVGDEVVLLGRQGDEVITVEDIAERLGTINYEVYTSILARIPRL